MPSSPITYRLAASADLPILVEMRLAFLVEVAGAQAEDENLRTALRDYFARSLPGGAFTAYLAESQGKVVACSGMIYDHHAPTPRNLTGIQPYVLNMYTLPEFRGRGIAARLLQLLVELAREQGHSTVLLHTLPKARPVYERAGFLPNDSEMRLKLQSEKPDSGS